MLLSANAGAAEHDWPAPARGEDEEARVSVSLSNRAGLVAAPFVTPAFPEVSGFSSVLIAGAGVRISLVDWVRLRLPVSFVRLDFPAKAQVSETALGNIELGVEHRLELRPSTRVGLVGAIVAPSAENGPKAAVLDNRALALGNALNGGLDAALLTPGVAGLRLAAAVEHWRYPFGFRARLALPLLLRVSDASLPRETETHPLGVLPSLDVRVGWWATSWFAASLGVGIASELVRVQEPFRDRDRQRRFQPLVEPGLHFRVGRHVTLGLDGSVPLGDNLGGKSFGVGVFGSLEL
jgi:hypothetical protein